MKKTYLLILILLSVSLFSQDKEEQWDFVFDSTVNDSKLIKPKPKKQEIIESEKIVVKIKKKKRKKTNKEVLKKVKLKQADNIKAKEKLKEKSEKKVDGEMDFSGVKLESDDLDGELEEEEEKEIDKEIAEDRGKIKTVDLKEKYERERRERAKDLKNYLVFFKLKSQMDYQNLMLFDNIPYQNTIGLEFSTSIMGLSLKKFDGFIGEIGYKFFYGSEFIQALIVSPLSISFYLKKWNRVFPLRVSVFKAYYLNKIIRGSGNKEIDLFFEYISFDLSWRFFKDRNFTTNVFLRISLGPDDIKATPKTQSLLFTIGVSGDFSPLKVEF